MDALQSQRKLFSIICQLILGGVGGGFGSLTAMIPGIFFNLRRKNDFLTLSITMQTMNVSAFSPKCL